MLLSLHSNKFTLKKYYYSATWGNYAIKALEKDAHAVLCLSFRNMLCIPQWLLIDGR